MHSLVPFNLWLVLTQPRVAITSRYSARTWVSFPTARLCVDHKADQFAPQVCLRVRVKRGERERRRTVIDTEELHDLIRRERIVAGICAFSAPYMSTLAERAF